MLKKLLPYLILFVTAATLRFAYLGVVPVSLSHDEVDMIIQAHSFRLTGSDLSQTWRAWYLLPNDAAMAELAPLVNAPLLSILPNNLFAAHATTALLGSIYPLLIVVFLLQLGWSKRVSWSAGVLLTLSPWHILFSRTSLEQPTSLFFYTLSWLSLYTLYNAKNKKSFLLSTFSFLACYILGFYTYHGFKFALPLLTLILATYHAVKTKYFVPLIISVILITSLFLRIYQNPTIYSSRGSEIVFSQTDKFGKLVDQERRISLTSSVLTNAYANKAVVMLRSLSDKYLYTLNPTLIYSRGEPNGVFGTGRTPYLPFFLLPVVIIGLTQLLLGVERGRGYLILILLLISPIATVIHINHSLAFRSAIYFVLLNITAAVGIEHLVRRVRRLPLMLIGLFLLLFNTFYFSYVYLALHPVESARAYFFPDRVLATYLSHRSDEKILVIDPQPRYIMSYLALTKSEITHETIMPLTNNYNPAEEKNAYTLDNLTIRRDCPATSELFDSIIVDASLIDGLKGCAALDSLPDKYLLRKIVDPLDNGGKKIILGDVVCKDYMLNTYTNPRRLSDFNLDKMSQAQFCNTWIIEN